MASSRLSDIEFRQLSDRLLRLRQFLPIRPPPGGWLKTVRRALGMTSAQLAERLKVSQPSIVRTEEREVSGTISLQTMRKMANELDCDLVYYLLPRSSLLHTVEERAAALAMSESAAVAHSMALDWGRTLRDDTLTSVDRERHRLVTERPPRMWE